MPMEGAHAPPQKPPADAYGLQRWYVFLDQVREEGLVPADRVEAEKAVIDESRLIASAGNAGTVR